MRLPSASSGGAGIAPELLARFKDDWHQITCALGVDPALIAFSGGPDSTALLLAREAFGELITAATVDHGLRAESAAEADAAHAFCENRGIAHRILRGELPARANGSANVSARARQLRYTLLAKHAAETRARWIVTAHHADDQLETMVMRLNRGAGVGGLAGIRVKHGKIIRPLIEWRRAELVQIVERLGLDVVADPTNNDERYDRARLRKLLARSDLLDADRVATAARALGRADEALDWAAQRLERDLCQAVDDRVLLARSDVPDELLRRLTLRCLRRLDPHTQPRSDRLNAFVDRLEAGDSATLAGFRGEAVRLRDGVVWVFRPAPPRRSH